MLPGNKPDEITSFSHAVVPIFCAVVYYLVLGACGIQESDVKIKGTAANCVTLTSAIVCAGFEKPKRQHCTTGFLPYCRS